MYFEEILKTSHYKDFHESSFPWSKVIEIILTNKNPRRKGDRIQFETTQYVLGYVQDKKLRIINAKWK